MDINQIRKLMRLIQNTDITEIEVTEGEQAVRISRRTPEPEIQHVAVPQPHVAAAAPAAAPVSSPEPSAVSNNKTNVVVSPMVGTFYRASSPEAEPFVKEGSKVKKGDTLCIIEAMKLMNEIEAEYAGVVEQVLVENASPVEYSQPMFVIIPTN